jgi:hypothetical protein
MGVCGSRDVLLLGEVRRAGDKCQPNSAEEAKGSTILVGQESAALSQTRRTAGHHTLTTASPDYESRCQVFESPRARLLFHQHHSHFGYAFEHPTDDVAAHAGAGVGAVFRSRQRLAVEVLPASARRCSWRSRTWPADATSSVAPTGVAASSSSPAGPRPRIVRSSVAMPHRRAGDVKGSGDQGCEGNIAISKRSRK